MKTFEFVNMKTLLVRTAVFVTVAAVVSFYFSAIIPPIPTTDPGTVRDVMFVFLGIGSIVGGAAIGVAKIVTDLLFG